MKPVVLLAFAAVAACQSMADATNESALNAGVLEARAQEQDAASWRGIPILELETHPFLSTLDREVNALSDGSQIWNYKACRRSAPGRRGGEIKEWCCVRQFRVRDQRVESLRMVGACVSGCKVRPAGCVASR
jgi:hypothetical protein